MLVGSRQEMLGVNNFHPASSHSLTHWKLTYSSTSKAVLLLYTSLWVFLNIDIHQKHHNPIHQLLTARSHSSLRARGHVGCWVEFHPASLSERWNWCSRVFMVFSCSRCADLKPFWVHYVFDNKVNWKWTHTISTFISAILNDSEMKHSQTQDKYRKTPSISRTKSQNLNVSCLLLLWSLANPLQPCVKLRMKM